MPMFWIIVLGVIAAIGLIGLVAYAWVRYFVARTDRTFMTHDEHGFRRALTGRGVLWDFEEGIVKGEGAPRVEYVALDPATGGRRTGRLLDPKTGSVNLRPQYCVPLPFFATTADAHKMVVEARVQFSLNRDLLKYVYQLEDFGLALETRIQSAFRAEIGKRPDEDLRASLHAVETAVVEHLRKAERDGDEVGEAGMALGVNFHAASFSYSDAEDAHGAPLALMSAAPAMLGAPGLDVGAAAVTDRARALPRSQGVLALRPQQLDQLADVFKNRDPAAAQGLLAMLEMQTRQNIAEALSVSGQLVVLTAEEVGLSGALTQQDRVARVLARADAAHVAPEKGNGQSQAI